MTLAFHHFKKDVRQFRIYLVIWFGLLFLDLAVNLGWVGRVEYTPDRGFDHASNTWTTMLPGVIWALVGLLPSLVVLADSPARREGFLATRPLPKRDLLLAKIIFVLALIVAPWVLQELVHLIWQGMPAWVVERGMLERLMFTLPVAFGCAAFAALWPSPARWARAIGIGVVVYALVGIVVSLCVHFFHLKGIWIGQGNPPAIVSMYALVLTLTAFALWHSRAHRGVLTRWSGLMVVVFVTPWASYLWPAESGKLKPADQAAANAVMARSGFEIPAHAIILQKEQASEESLQPEFNVNITPKTKTLPPGHVVEWSGKAVKLSRAAGGEMSGDGNVFHSKLFHWNSWNNVFNPDDIVAWAADFPENVLFRYGNYVGEDPSASLHLSKFKVPAGHQELTEPLTLRASLEARVFQWRKIAELPIKPGATATDEFGAWKFVATKQDPLPYPSFYYLERRQISLSTAADSRCSSQFDGPLTRMVWMVYDPVRHVAWMPDSSAFRSAERGTQTALVHYFITLSFFNLQKMFSAEELAHCRLLVFEKNWLGSVPESWQSAAFTLDEKLLPVTVAGGGNSEPMSRPEFNGRVAALKTPAPDAPRGEVSRYLLEFLRLVDAQRYPLNTRDPVTLQLARFVPAHLDLLLDGLPVMGGSYATVINAIKVGATDEQKPVIIAALPKYPVLADVLLARDWVTDARPEIYQLAKSPRPLPYGALQAIAWFHDPQTYPRLLEEFEASPGVSEYAFLRTLPGLEQELDAIVARHWRADRLVLREPGWQMFNESFRLAMHLGETSALQRAYQVLDDPDFNRLNIAINLGSPLAETVQMLGLKPADRHNYGVVLPWMRQHRPEDFVFSPARRQFVLKPTP